MQRYEFREIQRNNLQILHTSSKHLLIHICMSPALVPSLPSRPVITPELIGHSVHLRCAFVPPPWSQTLAFQVVWARHISHKMKAEIRQESTLKPFSLVEMDGVHFRLGETVIPTRLDWEGGERMWKASAPGEQLEIWIKLTKLRFFARVLLSESKSRQGMPLRLC